jgi:hypothetical protein
MGGQLPSTVEVRNPGLDTTVKIDVPTAENARIYKILSRDNIIRLCMHALQSVPEWKSVIERQMAKGQTLQLAWRVGTNLDWIWLEHDTYGDPRQWAVLCGLALKQVGVANLIWHHAHDEIAVNGACCSGNPHRSTLPGTHSSKERKSPSRTSIHRGISPTGATLLSYESERVLSDTRRKSLCPHSSSRLSAIAPRSCVKRR